MKDDSHARIDSLSSRVERMYNFWWTPIQKGRLFQLVRRCKNEKEEAK